MIEEIKDSVTKSIKERVFNPLYGSIIIAWLLWNWEIVYLTLFIDGDNLKVNKIDYIMEKYANFGHNLLFPILSGFLFVTVMPLITNLVYLITLSYKRQRDNIENRFDKKVSFSRSDYEIFSEEYEKRFGTLLIEFIYYKYNLVDNQHIDNKEKEKIQVEIYDSVILSKFILLDIYNVLSKEKIETPNNHKLLKIIELLEYIKIDEKKEIVITDRGVSVLKTILYKYPKILDIEK